MAISRNFAAYPRRRQEATERNRQLLDNLDGYITYTTYTTESGTTVNIPKAFTNREQENDYQNFIIILADVLKKYGAEVPKNE